MNMFILKPQRHLTPAKRWTIYIGVVFFSLCFSAFGQAQNAASKNVWQDVKESSVAVSGPRQIVPQSYRTVHLDNAGLSQLLAQAPLEFTEAAKKGQVVITLPMPDGALARFRIEESPMSLPDPTGKVSDFKTYSGQGIDGPTATVRFDMSSAGFHAQILSAGETVYIDPYSTNDTSNCISYYKRDLQRSGARPECFASISDHFGVLGTPGLSRSANLTGLTPSGANGTMLRSY